MSPHLDLCTLFPLIAGLFRIESVAIISVFWWLPAPSWRAICLLIFFFSLLKCFPFSFHLCGIAMRNFVVSLAFQRHPHHLLVICLLVKNVPRCQALSALLHVWRLSSSSHIRLYVLSPWPLQRRRNLAECADVRAVATVKEWCFAEEILDLAF